ncbi:aldo/keto reductase [Pseudonocardia nematodicida]|uniref:Aldo/keto reductase n=1 Tax=Pseudonocardia nematodicida TaxID=1206997 RepID=A0ABV1KFE8_9PSEU
MQTTEVPGTGLTVSRLVLGTMNIGDTVDRDGAAAMLDAAAEAGITMIDTANGYAGSRCEEILGGLLRERPGRFDVASKVGIPHPDAGGAPPLSAKAIHACVEGSLTRLGVEKLDVYYLHQPDRATPFAETLETVAALADAGTIGALGVSNFAAWQIAELRHAAVVAGAPQPTFSQPLYNLLARRIEEEYAEFSRTAGLFDVVYNPLGGGLLSGRHSFDAPPADGRFGSSGLATMYRDRYWSEGLFRGVEALSRVAADAGIGLPELALRWLVGNDGVGAVLIGASKVEQLHANVAAAERGRLPDDVVAACDAVWTDLRGPVPAYNR